MTTPPIDSTKPTFVFLDSEKLQTGFPSGWAAVIGAVMAGIAGPFLDSLFAIAPGTNG
jgi:hypothetical protein